MTYPKLSSKLHESDAAERFEREVFSALARTSRFRSSEFPSPWGGGNNTRVTRQSELQALLPRVWRSPSRTGIRKHTESSAPKLKNRVLQNTSNEGRSQHHLSGTHLA